MGNITSYYNNQIVNTKNIIVTDNKNNKYYTNNYLREWIAKYRIDMSYHNWLPIGVNYTSIVRTINSGFVCEVYEIKPFFMKTNLSINTHLCNHYFINNNCYILLNKTQQELFGLIDLESDKNTNIKNNSSDDKHVDDLSWDNQNEKISKINHQQYINKLVEDIDNLISSQYEIND
jgi:hypothetical protein